MEGLCKQVSLQPTISTTLSRVPEQRTAVDWLCSKTKLMLICLFSSVTLSTGPTYLPLMLMRIQYQSISTGGRRGCRFATVILSESTNRVIPYDLRNSSVSGGTEIMSSHTLKMQAQAAAATASSEGKQGKRTTVPETTLLSSSSTTKYELRFRL